MKFRKFGHAMLAAVVSAGMVLGLASCTSSFTVAYFYVIGQQYNQITGYKVDNNTGKLTQIANLPIGTGGTMPIQNLILPAGRFLYVLNQGGSDGLSGAGVVRFVIGGTGILTQQDGLTPSQGATPLRMAVDSSGSFLYVLDKTAPSPVNCPPPPTGVVAPTTCSDISVFKIDPNTGRLTPVVNQQLINPATGANLTYFPVPGNAVDMALVGSTVYLATDNVSSADNVTPVEQVTGFTSASGQLTTTSTGTQSVSAVHINRLVGGYTSSNAIGSASTYIYILDRGAPETGTGFFTQSKVWTYTGNNGALTSVSGSPIEQVGTVNNPNFLLTENSKNVVYVSNGGDAPDASTTNGAGYITAYLITVASGQGAGQLTVQPDSPFTTEAGPRCIIEDPSNQYIYSIDHDANNISLRKLDTTHYNLTTPRAAGSYATVNQPVWGVMTNRTQ
jgi:6-phosphogluconolactonase